jgi:hypothetical protein
MTAAGPDTSDGLGQVTLTWDLIGSTILCTEIAFQGLTQPGSVASWISKTGYIFLVLSWLLQAGPSF